MVLRVRVNVESRLLRATHCRLSDIEANPSAWAIRSAIWSFRHFVF